MNLNNVEILLKEIGDLKAENERLKEKCECQEADIDLYRDDIEKLMMDKDNLEKQLLDKTSSEEVLRKAIEEALELLQAPGSSIDDVEIIQTLRNALPNEPTINKKTFNRIVKETIEEAEAQERKEGE